MFDENLQVSSYRIQSDKSVGMLCLFFFFVLMKFQRDKFCEIGIDLHRAFQLTMIYTKRFSSNVNDEIIIKQKINVTNQRTIVYRGLLTRNGRVHFHFQ